MRPFDHLNLPVFFAVAVLLAAPGCSRAADPDPLNRVLGADAAISAERLGEALAARAGTDAAQDVAHLLAGAMITTCEEGARDGIITTSTERDCLRKLTLHDAWSARLDNVFSTPAAVSEPGWLVLLILVAAVILVAPWAVDRAIRVAGWQLRRLTGGAWFRLGMPAQLVITLLAGLAVFAAVVAVLLFLDVGMPWGWSGRWRQFVVLAWVPLLALLALALATALVKGSGMSGDARRIVALLAAKPTPGAAVHAPGVPTRTGPKNILICCDGTGNRSEAVEEGRRAVSNVRKLFEVAESAAESEWRQEKWYDSGVGTGTSGTSNRLSMLERVANWIAVNTPAQVLGVLGKVRIFLELGFGIGITENITQGYAEIVRLYQPGDRIFIVGFSRGAYTARCIADLIDDIGLLKSAHLRHAPDIVQHYRYRIGTGTTVSLRQELLHQDVQIEFLGLWDTVASLGVPLWGQSFSIAKLWSNAGFGATDIRNCRFIRHALSMDEQRSQFFPTLFDEPAHQDDPPRLKQRWFRGSHSGVGGGYADTSLSDIALQWMIDEAAAHGLCVHADWQQTVLKTTEQEFCPNPLGDVLTQLERQRAWRLAGAWPRWHPCKTTSHDGFGSLDESVRTRADHARSLRHAEAPVSSDELLTLEEGERATVVVRADLGWNRTGVVLEQGASYRISYAGGTWQDKEAPICGPSGQDARGFDARRLLGQGKRVIRGRWMELIGHVAHPRRWNPEERSGWDLLYYLIFRDPKELTRTLIPLGRHLTAPGSAVDVQIDALSGVFYGYANDWWLFYSNNSGSIRLSIERLGRTSQPSDVPRYIVAGDGGIMDAKRQPVDL